MARRIQGTPAYWRQGLWLGLAWGVVEVGALGGVARLPLLPALGEIAMSSAIWAGIGAVLGRFFGERVRSGPLILIALFFAASSNLLIHPFLLAGVTLLTPVGLLYGLGFTTIFFVPVWVANRMVRVLPRAVPPVLMVFAALVMGGAFAVGRIYLQGWPPDLGRVGAAILVAILGETFVFTVVIRARQPHFALGRWAAVLLLITLAGPAPVLLWPQPTKVNTTTAPGSAPPVILISLDTLRPDHLSVFGYHRQTSPRLDEFLETSRLFPRAYATAPWTYPSHASVFTGLYPRSHGAHYEAGGKPGEPPRALDPRPSTMAEKFSKMGYATAAIVSNRLAVSPELGLDRGFQEVQADLRISTRPIPLNYIRSATRLLRPRWLSRLMRTHPDAAELTNLALAWIDEHQREPFFLFLNYLDPHDPYVPPIEFLPGYEEMSWRDRLEWKIKPVGKVDSSMDGYDGEIRYLDSELDRLFGTLESTGLFDRAIIVVFSDHGEFFGELGLYGHGRDLHEAVLRALLAVRSPKGTHAGVDSSLASLVDIPSMVDDCLEGFVPRPREVDGPRVVGEKYLNQRDMKRAPRFGGSDRFVAVRWGDYKLIEHQTVSLFNVREDPEETTDLSGTHPSIVSRMQGYLAVWHEGDSTAPRDTRDAGNETLRETLQGLGYIQ